jgi:uncharacterized membrane protein
MGLGMVFASYKTASKDKGGSMFLVDLLLAFLIAAVLTGIMGFGLRRSPGWGGILVFFVLILLIAWLASLWVTPIEPTVHGTNWVPMIIAGIVAVLFISALNPLWLEKRDQFWPARREEKEAQAVVGFSVLLWWLLMLLVIIIVTAYVARAVT